jgi:methylenetetrahydrofolate reductase (NADPH)
MKIIDILSRSTRPIFSFEFFPPKTEEGRTELFEALKKVKTLNPGYISVTYGAGGGTRDKTIEIVEQAKNILGLESMAHLTCVGHSKEEIKKILDELETSGIENVVALRGDPPKGETSFKPNPGGFKYASELTEFIRASYSFCIAVAGYPEGHVESPNKETDWDYLSQKVKAGADFIITQLFFDNYHYFAFENRLREKGVTVPIIPGIMPITNYHQIVRFTQMCGAKIPEKIIRDLQPIQNDLVEVQRYGIEYATSQCKELIAHGVPGIHFYTLNKSHASQEIIRRLKG